MSETVLENLADVRMFVAIVELGSLVAAARKLGWKANAVSRRLSAMEGRVGQRLIHRTTRRLSVTEEGHRLASRCRRILAELDEAERELAGEAVATTLRLIIHPGMVSHRLMAGLGGLLRRSEQLRFRVNVSSDFVDPIADGADVSIHVGRPPSSSLVARSLGKMQWVLAADRAYLEREGRPRNPQQLVEHECLRLLREPPEDHWTLSRGEAGRPTRFPISGRLELSDGDALSHALDAGLGIGIRLAASLVVGGRIERVLPEWQWAATPIFALMPSGRQKSPHVRHTLDVLADCLAAVTYSAHDKSPTTAPTGRPAPLTRRDSVQNPNSRSMVGRTSR
ncbi:MAG: LysR family transcriptional regulator [Archangium sp.]|nr:LysR family transcriptional regulator [Archangium sp.]